MLGLGKRKRAVAIASVKKGTGKTRINSRPLELFEPRLNQLRIQEALSVAGAMAKSVDITVNVRGGGNSAQADAIRTAIGTGLAKFSKDKSVEKAFKEYDRTLLVSDMRQSESKKPGGRGARSKVQKSYR